MLLAPGGEPSFGDDGAGGNGGERRRSERDAACSSAGKGAREPDAEGDQSRYDHDRAGSRGNERERHNGDHRARWACGDLIAERRSRRCRDRERCARDGSCQQRSEHQGVGDAGGTDAVRHLVADSTTEPEENDRRGHDDERHDRGGQRRRGGDPAQAPQVAARHRLTERRMHL